MAQAASSHDHSGGHNLDLAMGICLLLGAGAIAYMFASAPEVPDVTAESFVVTAPKVDIGKLQAAREKHYAKPDLAAVQSEVEGVYAQMKSANLAQFEQASAKSAHALQIQTVHAANELITKTKIEGFVPAGEKMFTDCAAGFAEVQAAVKAGELTSEQAATDPGGKFQKYRENCGNAYKSLRDSAVIDEKGQWADATSGPLLFNIMNRFRWAAVLDLRSPPWKQLAPYEYELLTLWRVSLRNVPIAKRVQWVVEAEKVVPNLPIEQLIGSLLFEDGDLTGALGAYEEACAENRGDIFLQRKCEYLRSAAQKGAAPKAPAGH